LNALTNCSSSGVGPASRGCDLSGHLEIVHPVQEFRPVRLGHAENFAQREQRQPRRQLFDQVAFAKACNAVDQPPGLGGDLVLEPAEIGRREIRHMLAAKLQVPGRIHVDHGVDGGAKQQRMARLRWTVRHQDSALLRRKGRRITIDAHHVIVAGERPETGPAGALPLPRHRRIGAQPCKNVKRLSLREQVRVGEHILVAFGIGLGINGAGRQAGRHGLTQKSHETFSGQAKGFTGGR
jgi:hypothetical protein